MQDAKNNEAVALLTGTEADVHLKVYREHLVVKNVRREKINHAEMLHDAMQM